MFNPVSTYRIQFHKEFTFKHFEQIIPYLHKLGIKTVYASPIFSSTPGSTHGYDGVNPLAINPEIGTLEELKAISEQLKQKGISWLQDIVPNHMAFHPDNPWLMDVLANGPASPYKDHFDQSLADADFFTSPIMVPFLGSPLDEVIDNGELTIAMQGQKPVFKYAEQIWPLNAETADTINTTGADKANADKALLKKIAGQQYYRLCSWKETDHQINFRRFFTVNGLICLNIQRQEVFDDFHQLIKTLMLTGVFQGLRIDHIDGLYDPTQYLERLRAMAGDDTYIVVEKILEPGEKMEPWPIQGNTGYDFLAIVNNLFTTRKSEEAFNRFYQSVVADDMPVHQQIENKKAHILKCHMAGELDNLTNFFFKLQLCADDDLADISTGQLKQTIGLFLIKCPVYRFYGNQMPLAKQERKALKAILKSIGESQNDLLPVVKLLQKVLIKSPKQQDDDHNSRTLRFYQRCMQFTGPLMAKGVEDTLMYTYNRFIDHNEVGDAPGAFGISADQFHQQMQARQKHWPLSINGTSTHDTKRGEDVRARLNVLSNMPDEWLNHLREWQDLNADLKNADAPDANDELFIYQTLIGAYPMPGQPNDNFSERLQAYLEKTLREGKQNSNWAEPNMAYEQSTKQFALNLLDEGRPFWQSFSTLHAKVSDLGIINSLSQSLLKFTCPGIPDVYQGCEHWDLSMVDPDNRRPVNYDLRTQLLDTQKAIPGLWQDRFNGQIKVKLVQTLLSLRKYEPLLFAEGKYLPLEVTGTYSQHILAFARNYRDKWLIVIIPLNVASLCEGQQTQIEKLDWADTAVIMPENAAGECEDLLTGEIAKPEKQIEIKNIFNDLPLCVLKIARPDSDRAAGVLLHISSLPSNYAIGDLGPQARAFADLLYKAHQTYWQILPINPTIASAGHSPYSAYSSRGGNTLLISPELLAADGLIPKADMDEYCLPYTNKVDFEAAARLKNSLLDIAWGNFSKDTSLQSDLTEYCQQEAGWLDDHALFVVLKQQHQDQPWNQWPDEYKTRQAKALTQFTAKNNDAINKEKWLQYIFNRQWQQLKGYCSALNIKLFGDLPFYMSYDSADVWANPGSFGLSDSYEPQTVAGVPPDYFNADGQLWGMPVYNWDALKADNYQWWISRIRKNLEWFDLLRLDHFRAFSAYWAVPATEKTAINGKWLPGPGADLFNALKDAFSELPFVAEDLGEIDEPVYQLRDQFNFPGMKVLQFAFGDELPYSPHAPHHHSANHLVYTGTHDNNTTLGWFRQDIDDQTIKQLTTYIGGKVTKNNINGLLIKMAYASVCKLAVTPLQDVLDLDADTRMNMPASTAGNWTWQVTPAQLRSFPVKWLRKLSQLYQR